MKIGLNLLYLIPGEVGGTETYGLSLIQALSQVDQHNTYLLFVNNESKHLVLPGSDRFRKVVCNVNAKNRISRFLWEQLILPLQAAYYRLDVLHSLGYVTPFFLSCASVVTIHDLNYLAVPESLTPLGRLVQRIFVTFATRRSDRLIAVSEFTKCELIKHLSVPEYKIQVTHEAPKQRGETALSEHKTTGAGEIFGINKPYILAFSSLSPHKNIERLMKAFLKANDDDENNWQLVIIGHLPRNSEAVYEQIHKQYGEYSPFVLTGYIPDQQVRFLLNHADLFAFSSLYEGFGLPVLEAMEAGVPVACSNRGSLPEIAGEAAVYFDPLDIEAMSAALGSLMRNPTLRILLAAKGKDNVQRFSWQRCAENTLRTYTQVVASTNYKMNNKING